MPSGTTPARRSTHTNATTIANAPATAAIFPPIRRSPIVNGVSSTWYSMW